MDYGLMPLGVLPAGAVAERLGIKTATGMLAFLLLAVAALMLFRPRRTRLLA